MQKNHFTFADMQALYPSKPFKINLLLSGMENATIRARITKGGN